MATCFDRWEKDPFFSAAEEVQESADRMESVYRRWIRETRSPSSSNSTNLIDNAEQLSGEILTELRTVLGTAKWQLEELEKAIRSNDEACSATEGVRTRHKQFVAAIRDQILKVENSMLQSNQDDDKHAKLTWVHLDDGERDELAVFLALPPLPKQDKVAKTQIDELKLAGSWEDACQKNDINSINVTWMGEKKEKMQGHRRVASASADIESWKITLSNDDSRRSFQEELVMPPAKIPSLSCLAKALESTATTKCSKNGFRKWKGEDECQAAEMLPLRTNQLSQDINGCYERSKSCLDCSDEEHYDKQLSGLLGAFHRQLQRSQYQIQYGRPVLTVVWAILFSLLFVLVALRTFERSSLFLL